MLTKPQPKTRADAIRERAEQIDWQYEMAARREAEQAERLKSQEDFARRVNAARAAHAGVVHRLEMQVEDGRLTQEQANAINAAANQEAFAEARERLAATGGLAGYFEAKRAEELAAEAEAERQRIASISNHDRWVASLDWPDRERVRKYEAIMRVPHPLAPH